MFNSDFRRLCLIPFVLVGMIATGFAVDLNKSEWAYWVQAIGSIATLIGAFVLGKRQSLIEKANALELADIAIKRRWAAVQGVINDLYQQCIDVEIAFSEPDEDFGNVAFIFRYDQRTFEAALARAEHIPVFELNSSTLVKNVLDFQRNANEIKGWVEVAQKIMAHDFTDEVTCAQVKECASTQITDLKATYHSIADETGGERISKARPMGRFSL